MSSTLAVIPARFSSTRLPGKPLIEIQDKPLIQWVYDSVVATNLLDEVIVATDENKIKTVVEDFGGKVELTDKNHKSGTDRVREVSLRHPEYEYVLNIQGDEPIIKKDWIEKLTIPLKEGINISTLCTKKKDIKEFKDNNVVKVVLDNTSHALFFSRASIPYPRDIDEIFFYKHVGLYGFRTQFLKNLPNLSNCLLEDIEKLEQLRFLSNGYEIKCNIIEGENIDINTRSDIDRFLNYLKINDEI